VSSYQEKAKQLKRLGLIDYDLRSKLNRGQKSHITKLEREFKALLARPEDYTKLDISDRRAGNISGEAFKIKPKGSKKTKVFYLGEVKKVGRKSVTVKQRNFIHEVFDSGGKNILDKISDAAQRLKPDQNLMVSIGGRIFNQQFANKHALDKYLRDWVPKDEKDRDRLMGEMVITTVDLPDDIKPKRRKNAKKKTPPSSN